MTQLEEITARLRGERDKYPLDASDDAWNSALDTAQAIVTEVLGRDAWRPISDAPRDMPFDSFGEFWPHHAKEPLYIRFTDDFFSSNTPYPLTRTNHLHDDMAGNYTRTHWMPIPQPPAGVQSHE